MAVVLVVLAVLSVWLGTSRSYWRWRAMRAEAEVVAWKRMWQVEIVSSKFARRDHG